MRRDREDKFDPTQPALIVTYGNTTRKHRPLDRDLLILGRSSCCDIGLVSPEVAPIHCIIARAADGWRVRDCTGRSGTRVNGQAVHEEVLNDGDTLQVGTFSFQLNLPRAAAAEPSASAAPPAPVVPSQFVGDRLDVAKLHRLQKSRERLARRALEMRKQLQVAKSGQHAPVAPVAPSRFEAELGEKRAALETLEKKLAAREAELNEQDRGIRNEYRDLEKQRKELEKFAQETLAKKQAELERKADGFLAERRRELDRLGETLRARERELEEEHGRLGGDVRKKEHDLDEQLRQAERLNAELAATREALRLEFEGAVRAGQEADTKVREAEAHATALWEQCEAHRRRAEAAGGPLGASPDATPARDLDIRARELDCYADHLRRTRLTLGQYEQELAEAYHQFQAEYERAAQNAGGAGPSGRGSVAEGVAAEARREAEQRQAEWTAKLTEERGRADRAAADSKAARDQVAALREEVRQRETVVEQLKAELKREQDKPRAASLSDEFELAAPDQLLATVERLQREIANRDAHIRELRHHIEELESLSDPAEKEAYEAELNNYRVELGRDRTALAQERAQLARERAEVNCLREQLRREQGSAPKSESGARERQKLKQAKSETAEAQPEAQVPAAPRQPTQADLIARLARGSKHGTNRKDEG